MENKISATKIQCKHCFDVVVAKLSNSPLPPYPHSELDPEVPIFVTWKKNNELRGCIGTF